jgi:hypothetical protein
MSRAKRAEPVTLVRSPTFTKSDSGPTARGSSPDRRRRVGRSGMTRGGSPATVSAMARMWEGVVPQQPPTMLAKPASANSRMTFAMASGDSSYSPNSLGRPALGWLDTSVSATVEISSR